MIKYFILSFMILSAGYYPAVRIAYHKGESDGYLKAWKECPKNTFTGSPQVIQCQKTKTLGFTINGFGIGGWHERNN